MKRIELTISKLLCTALLVTGTLLSTSCKKDGPVAPKDEKLEITTSVEVDYTGATFSGTLELGADVSATAEAGIEYADNSDFNNATKVVAKSNDKGAYSVSIDGLLLGTTYYYRTYTLASKESSPVYGESSNFTTKDLTVTLSAGEISIEGVTISGTVDALPEGISLSVAYASSEDASEWSELAVSPEQSENGYVFSTSITDIEENSAVWYKAVATYGDNKKDYAKASLTFKNEITLEYITINDATYPEVEGKDGSVKFTGSVNIPESLKTAYSPKVVFKYSTDENFAEAVTVSTEITGSTIEIVKTDLVPSTTYYYKAELTVGSSTSSTTVKSFTSKNLQFSLTPLASSIKETSATMTGSIIGYSGWDVKGLTFYTRYSTNEDCSNATDVEMQYDDSPWAFFPYTCSLSGLQPSTKYYYCLVIKKGEDVKSVGDINSFTTAGPVTVEFATSDLAGASGSGTDSPKTISKDNITCVMAGLGSTAYFKFGSTASYVKITAPRNIQSVKLTSQTGTHTFRLKTAQAKGDSSDNDVAAYTLNGTETDVTLTPTGSNKTLWLTSSEAKKIYSMTIVYK